MSLGAIADASNATERLKGVFEAELLDDTYTIDESIQNAVQVKNASFTWDAPPPESTSDKGKKQKPGKISNSRRTSKSEADDTATNESMAHKEDKVFQLRDISMSVPRGQLVAVVGAVGSGKSSLLQGLIGEMRMTTGNVVFGGSVGYCPQIAWIQVPHSDFVKKRSLYLIFFVFLSFFFVLFLIERNHSGKHMLRPSF